MMKCPPNEVSQHRSREYADKLNTRTKVGLNDIQALQSTLLPLQGRHASVRAVHCSPSSLASRLSRLAHKEASDNQKLSCSYGHWKQQVYSHWSSALGGPRAPTERSHEHESDPYLFIHRSTLTSSTFASQCTCTCLCF